MNKPSDQGKDISDEIYQYLLGSCKSEFDAAEAFGVDAESILSITSQLDIERCETCSWWCETGELDEENNCEDCRS